MERTRAVCARPSHPSPSPSVRSQPSLKVNVLSAPPPLLPRVPSLISPAHLPAGLRLRLPGSAARALSCARWGETPDPAVTLTFTASSHRQSVRSTESSFADLLFFVNSEQRIFEANTGSTSHNGGNLCVALNRPVVLSMCCTHTHARTHARKEHSRRPANPRQDQVNNENTHTHTHTHT